jgi:hypothetical protein
MSGKRSDRLSLALAVLAGCLSRGYQSGAQAAADEAQIVGTWRGHSTCMVKESPCRDEVNVYRISKIAGKPGWVSVVGGKIVDGQEIVMGTGEWKYDAQKHVLESPDGSFRFTLGGESLEGTLTRDKTVYRRIYLKKQE